MHKLDCFIVGCFIVGIIILPIGAVQRGQQNLEMEAADGNNSTCVITSIGALDTYCYGYSCQLTFTLGYYPTHYSNNSYTQSIPNGVDGYEPNSFTLDQTVQCYSQDFANGVVVVWKRDQYSPATDGLFYGGISFLVVGVVCLLLTLACSLFCNK